MINILKRFFGKFHHGNALCCEKDSEFHHENALRYEKDSNEITIKDHFANVYQAVQEAKEKGILWGSSNDIWFKDNDALADFMKYIADKKCLEIGSGPFGYLGPRDWINQRYIIDPLILFYRQSELELLGKTFFTDDIKLYNINAEEMVDELVEQIDGAIICQNTLDHCNDPKQILYNISKYAAIGCYFLLWTDIYHKQCDQGHRNITKDTDEMDEMLRNLGFELIGKTSNVRNDDSTIAYGRLARKTVYSPE